MPLAAAMPDCAFTMHESTEGSHCSSTMLYATMRPSGHGCAYFVLALFHASAHEASGRHSLHNSSLTF
eukprot:5106118-Prorocentrum_lima.AAC.1